ncbi:hypothetical protein SHIRM173S_12606 [Streptomyces hirsutus]
MRAFRPEKLTVSASTSTCPASTAVTDSSGRCTAIGRLAGTMSAPMQIRGVATSMTGMVIEPVSWVT